MAYVAANVDHQIGTANTKDHVGVNSECVALVRAFTSAPNTAQWLRGEKVQGNTHIAKGTVIATFPDGHYQGHAAIYLGDAGDGIRVYDQWNSQRPHERIIHYTGHHAYVDDGTHYYVVD